MHLHVLHALHALETALATLKTDFVIGFGSEKQEIPQRGPTSFCRYPWSKCLRNNVLEMKLKTPGTYDVHEGSCLVLGRPLEL